MEFVRYGNLIPQQHDRPTNENEWTFHTPPCEYGFYAFPKGFVEPFLLGGIGSGNVRNGRFKFLKDENGNKVYVKYGDFFTENYDEKTYKYYVKDKWLPLLKKNGLTHNDVVAYLEDASVPVGTNVEYWHSGTYYYNLEDALEDIKSRGL